MQAPPDKHAVVLAYYFPPLGLSGVQRIAKLVKYLPLFGWKVTVITPEPGSYFAFDEQLLAEVSENPHVRIERTRSWDPTRLKKSSGSNLIPFPEEASRKLFSTLSQWVLVPDNKIGWKRFAVKRAIECHAQTPFDLVFATAPPYTSFLAGREVATRLGIPLVLDYRDDWIGNPRHLYPTYWHKALNQRYERQAIAASKLVFSINAQIAQSIQNRHPECASRVSVVPQGFDPEDFEGHSSSSAESSPAASPGKMTFLYAGVFYDAQQPDSFLNALHRVFERRPEFKNVVQARFVGLFPESGKRLIEQLDLDVATEMTGYVDHNESVSALTECDVAWMIVGRQKGEEGISTGKLFEYFGSRKPILGLVPDGAAREALVQYGNARCVYPDDVEGISEAIEALITDWQNGKLRLADAEKAEPYNRKKQAAHIASMFDQIVL
ncbi:glycosyltransferase [bacterium]|nr:glycosyltransferase [bacterium]